MSIRTLGTKLPKKTNSNISTLYVNIFMVELFAMIRFFFQLFNSPNKKDCHF